MIPFLARPSIAGSRPSRRDWLRIGVPAAVGVLLPGFSSAKPAAAARAKSVIVVFTSGGQSQLETWDPKPSAPVEVRGAFGSRPTPIPGVRICEYQGVHYERDAAAMSDGDLLHAGEYLEPAPVPEPAFSSYESVRC